MPDTGWIRPGTAAIARLDYKPLSLRDPQLAIDNSETTGAYVTISGTSPYEALTASNFGFGALLKNDDLITGIEIQLILFWPSAARTTKAIRIGLSHSSVLTQYSTTGPNNTTVNGSITNTTRITHNNTRSETLTHTLGSATDLWGSPVDVAALTSNDFAFYLQPMFSKFGSSDSDNDTGRFEIRDIKLRVHYQQGGLTRFKDPETGVWRKVKPHFKDPETGVWRPVKPHLKDELWKST